MTHTVNIHEAKTHLSRLIERAVAGEAIIIAKAGKPLVRMTAIGTAELPAPQRLGFAAGWVQVPEDFDRMHAEEIARLFDAEA